MLNSCGEAGDILSSFSGAGATSSPLLGNGIRPIRQCELGCALTKHRSRGRADDVNRQTVGPEVETCWWQRWRRRPWPWRSRAMGTLTFELNRPDMIMSAGVAGVTRWRSVIQVGGLINIGTWPDDWQQNSRVWQAPTSAELKPSSGGSPWAEYHRQAA